MWMPGTQSNFYAKLNLNVYLKPSRDTERGGGEVSGVKLFTVTNLSNINQKNADEVFRNGEKSLLSKKKDAFALVSYLRKVLPFSEQLR